MYIYTHIYCILYSVFDCQARRRAASLPDPIDGIVWALGQDVCSICIYVYVVCYIYIYISTYLFVYLHVFLFIQLRGLRIQDSSEEIFSSYAKTGRSSLLSFTESFDFDSGDRLFDREPWIPGQGSPKRLKSAWIHMDSCAF